MTEARKLTVYFGERDRDGDAFLADRLLGIFSRHRIEASLLVRGAEGFGIKHHRRTDRLLTLSEDLPLVALAIDEPAAIEAALDQVRKLTFDGLVTVERAALLPDGDLPGHGGDAKLTAYLGRGTRADGEPAYRTATRLLRDAGAAGGTVIAGVDGTSGGVRRRARFFGLNASTPCMLISVGTAVSMERSAAALQALEVPDLLLSVERVSVLKRDGRRLGDLPGADSDDAAGRARWVKLILYSAEQNHFDGRPVHIEAVERLRRAGARGATAIRGVWGYHGDHDPHGDTFWSLRRRVPTVTVVIDRPEQAREWLGVLDAVTPETGLITSEIVPVAGPSGRPGAWRA